MNLGERQIGVLLVNLFRTPAIRTLIEDDFDHLDIRVVNPRNAALVQVNVGCGCRAHGASSFCVL
jgi:hypothetical protein